MHRIADSVARMWGSVGPGLVTGAADDDPAGITTFTQAGATYGYTFSWFALVTFPLMAVVQEMCARIGVVTGKGLAAHIRARYSRRALLVVATLLLVANIFNIAADISAIAEAVRLLFPTLPHVLLVLFFGGITALLQIHIPYATYAQYLKYLTLSLFAYVLVAVVSHVPWGDVFRATVMPTLPASNEAFFLLAALLGTTISPYLFFWQTAQEIEERRGKVSHLVRLRGSHTDVTTMRKDVWIGMFFSNLITFFVMVASAATLYASGITHVATLDDAMHALQLFGSLAPTLFALGIIGTGLLAIPVLAASSAYAFAEAFHWKEGLSYSFAQARAFYGVILFAIVCGCVASILHIDSVSMLLYSGFLNALLAPVVLYFVIRISSHQGIIREEASGVWSQRIGWITLLSMALSCAVVLLA